ncbi:hypothetical protein D3C71_1220950 [compost metagenome]
MADLLLTFGRGNVALFIHNQRLEWLLVQHLLQPFRLHLHHQDACPAEFRIGYVTDQAQLVDRARRAVAVYILIGDIQPIDPLILHDGVEPDARFDIGVHRRNRHIIHQRGIVDKEADIRNLAVLQNILIEHLVIVISLRQLQNIGITRIDKLV